jgi:hypothetical protein
MLAVAAEEFIIREQVVVLVVMVAVDKVER